MAENKWSLWALCLVVGTSCRSPQKTTGGGGVESGAPHDGSSLQARKEPPNEPPKEPESNSESATPRAPAPGEPEQDTVVEYAELTTRWGPGELVDLGPAASVAATPRGAIFITRDDQVVIAPRRGAAGFDPVSLPPEAFSKYGWGPSVSDGHVYWTSLSGRLMRASLSALEPEVLFDHARPTTRTSALTVRGRDLVAFVATIDDRSYAYLWASGQSAAPEIVDASADGHEATSVALVPGSPHPKLIVLEGRTSMSPVHVRTVRVTPRRITLDNNEIVWIGPGSHELTEIHALRTGGSPVAFLPTQRDFGTFGLAELIIPAQGGEAKEPTWQLFPNGLDPAPVASAHMCGGDYVVFARPSEERPRSPQELHIAPLEAPVPEGEVLVRSRAFNDVSLAPTKTGAVLVWTADRRSWGMVLTCPQ